MEETPIKVVHAWAISVGQEFIEVFIPADFIYFYLLNGLPEGTIIPMIPKHRGMNIEEIDFKEILVLEIPGTTT
ncbi:MAG TPA: hypothetical protein ENI04_01620 [Candidatus Wildermuthbacteria bacterium]|nr:hypothetical protein [Candidatus Wildermuthbacteria bacterium]